MIIKGQKVILRPIRLSDAPRFVKWLNDEGVYKFLLRQSGDLTLAKERKWIKDALKGRKTKRYFAIETLDGTHIGLTSLEVTPKDNRAMFGIFIGEKDYWSHGLGTDAARTIINYGFKALKLHRIELGVLEYNPRAMKVYRRLGFKKEGIKRDHVLYRGKYYADIQMGLLAGEWKG